MGLKALIGKSISTHGSVLVVGRPGRGESRSPIIFGEPTSTIGDSTIVTNLAGAPYRVVLQDVGMLLISFAL